ncbi:MAG: molybdenum cofactor guanylyltransferase [Deltaproteobacteria bacterium CG12_big_fil_rev_8_21_14_0_65_43_10]|nr:MAG: molybdenum cofactor guanylyltransferase [Deltaproteobacteria bacterium CG12_big_fil_rev_8_21_14_0_65_43_10]PIX23744.1 MAG: molybdenum cofactor guanylyltransferase [Deltaproteobacteria bacterium CG_4_8_14_3_um_filter_43_13]PIZ20777.1 MAG: molybdenum cofactor guanylyltransferase [Deltaproteobacteria bacterium CG_4_10_14_0_8_um_filter_43_12]PJB43734.1 MAG: molybdenum cofactor guanylyltransferase [Deltaproteobacteria bacterium CG_4_9_14_3_um_filter_44_9]
MTGVILAGGKSKRMGTNKAFLEINGQRMIDQIVDIFKNTFEEVILVTNSPIEYLHLDLRIVTDLVPNKGALGGIFTGLFYASFHHIFVTACDMPFLNKGFIDYMVSKAGNFDAVVPLSSDGLEPLHAIYSKRCIRHIETQLESDDLKITNFYPKVRVKEISHHEILSFDPKSSLFFNINTTEDMEKVRGEKI